MFAVAVFSIDLSRTPSPLSTWLQQVVVDPAAIADVLVGQWGIFIDAPCKLVIPDGSASTPKNPVRCLSRDESGSYFFAV